MYKETFKIFVVLLLTVTGSIQVCGQPSIPKLNAVAGLMTLSQSVPLKGWQPVFVPKPDLLKSSARLHLLSARSAQGNTFATISATAASPANFRLQPGILNQPIAIFRAKGFSSGLSTSNSSSMVVDQDLYVKGFGFFCKKELQVEKATRIPLRLRLGSLEQCNILEQKN